MEYWVIPIVAFSASMLTFFSGFGLGTLLTPVFALFFPIELAIALTGIVHFFNNIFKLFLVGRSANIGVVLRFGIPAILAAWLGAWLLLQLTQLNPLFSYSLRDNQYTVYPVQFIIALLLIIFAFFDLIPYLKNLKFSKKFLVFGGFVSGFFGGLSGHQGALRSAFLIKVGLSKEAFIGTAVVVSSCIDLTRITMYSTKFIYADLLNNVYLLSSATVAAILGAILGHKLLKKITINFLQIFVACLLIIISIALGAGII
jgi:uncharacterized membrane protein YfcA